MTCLDYKQIEKADVILRNSHVDMDLSLDESPRDFQTVLNFAPP